MFYMVLLVQWLQQPTSVTVIKGCLLFGRFDELPTLYGHVRANNLNKFDSDDSSTNIENIDG